jgi:hypothetical protein
MRVVRIGLAGLVFLFSGFGALCAEQLNCRVLYRISCAPDLCSALDKEIDHVPQMPDMNFTISPDRKTLTYSEAGRTQTLAITVRELGGQVQLVTGEPIDWPGYEPAPGGQDRDKPLGEVRMVFDGLEYYWRVGYLGHNESQEYEDVLFGDCEPAWN